MPVRSPDRKDQRVHGEFVDVLIAKRCGLYTYYQAARKTGHTEETIRQYAKSGHFYRVYVGSTPLIPEESIQSYIRYRDAKKTAH